MPSIPTQQFIKDKKRFDTWRSRSPSCLSSVFLRIGLE